MKQILFLTTAIVVFLACRMFLRQAFQGKRKNLRTSQVKENATLVQDPVTGEYRLSD